MAPRKRWDVRRGLNPYSSHILIETSMPRAATWTEFTAGAEGTDWVGEGAGDMRHAAKVAEA